jgi:hypothetical protein
VTNHVPLICPSCSVQMNITELTCPECQTKVQGVFRGTGMHRLNAEQLQFVEVFIRCRGNIKEVEKELKISYPTVRSRLDQIIQTMGYAATPSESEETKPKSPLEVLTALGEGSLSFDEALALLKEEKMNK